MRGQPGFFDFDDRLKLLSDQGDQLESFRSAVDFRAASAGIELSAAQLDESGWPPLDPGLMFKILTYRRLTSFGERAEFLINDSGCSGRS